MKLFREDKGFTLIEIILTLAIIALVIPIASNMMVHSFNIFNSGIYRMSTGQRVELALDQISNYLRSASEKPKKIDDETYEFDSYYSNNGEVILKLDDNDPNDYNLLLNDRIIADNVVTYSIIEAPADSGVYEIKISYRVREEESDDSVTKEKSLKAYPKNLN